MERAGGGGGEDRDVMEEEEDGGERGGRGGGVDGMEGRMSGGGGGRCGDRDPHSNNPHHNIHRMQERDRYPCDSVMDLSISKTPDNNRPGSGGSSDKGGGDNTSCSGDRERAGSVGDGASERGGGGRDRDRDPSSMPPPKTPSSESECEGKRDVTTTSATPVADNGIHHCQHCNIFFYDYTMFHLHESLHLPYEEYPFRYVTRLA
jgi:hypothetical protein